MRSFRLPPWGYHMMAGALVVVAGIVIGKTAPPLYKQIAPQQIVGVVIGFCGLVWCMAANAARKGNRNSWRCCRRCGCALTDDSIRVCPECSSKR
jgi:hypothetical protein